jgi:hypothetical protein
MAAWLIRWFTFRRGQGEGEDQLACSKSLLEDQISSIKDQLMDVPLTCSTVQGMVETPVSSSEGQIGDVLMTSSTAQGMAEAPETSSGSHTVVQTALVSSIVQLVDDATMASGRGQPVEAPVASPRVKKRARKEQLLQQHKLFGKTVLDRISKAAVMAYSLLSIQPNYKYVPLQYT